MPFATDAPVIEKALRELLAEFADRNGVQVFEDSSKEYTLKRLDASGDLQFFATVSPRKNYITFHLYPIYCDPTNLEGISEVLRKHLGGKSCFQFKKVDPPLFDELRQLIERCL